MRYAVKVEYLHGNCADVERVLPAGWEPIGAEVEEGNALRLVLIRTLTEAEEIAITESERQVQDSRKLLKELPRSAE